jgi:hypothetical protein
VQLCRLLFEMGPRVRISLPPAASLLRTGRRRAAFSRIMLGTGRSGRPGREIFGSAACSNIDPTAGGLFSHREPRARLGQLTAASRCS